MFYKVLKAIAIFTHPPLVIVGWVFGFLWYPLWHVGFKSGYSYLYIETVVQQVLAAEQKEVKNEA